MELSRSCKSYILISAELALRRGLHVFMKLQAKTEKISAAAKSLLMIKIESRTKTIPNTLSEAARHYWLLFGSVGDIKEALPYADFLKAGIVASLLEVSFQLQLFAKYVVNHIL